MENKYIYLNYQDQYKKIVFPENYTDLINSITKAYNIEKDHENFIQRIFYKINNDNNFLNIENEEDFKRFKDNKLNYIINLELNYVVDINKNVNINYNKNDFHNNNSNDNNLNEDNKYNISNHLKKYIDEYINEKIKIMKTKICLELYKKIFLNNNNFIIHYDIYCSKCNKIIEGIRYKCSECENYNLCSKCEEINNQTNEHEHDFYKIKKNKNTEKEKEVNEMVKKIKKEHNILKEYDDYIIIKLLINNKFDKDLVKKLLSNIKDIKNNDENNDINNNK